MSVRASFHVYLVSKSPLVKDGARRALEQMLTVVGRRMENAEERYWEEKRKEEERKGGREVNTPERAGGRNTEGEEGGEGKGEEVRTRRNDAWRLGHKMGNKRY